MALTKCEECGREISDRAASCPGCGCPIHAGGAPIPPAPPPARRATLEPGHPPPEGARASARRGKPPAHGLTKGEPVDLHVPEPPPGGSAPVKHRAEVKWRRPSGWPGLTWLAGLAVLVAAIYGIVYWEDVSRYAKARMDAMFGGVQKRVPAPDRGAPPE